MSHADRHKCQMRSHWRRSIVWTWHGEQQEAAEGAVVVAVVPDLRVVPQLHRECVALLQKQGSTIGGRIAAITG